MGLWTYVGQIVNFIIFVVILQYLLYKPVRNILRERKEEMESDLREAEKTRKEADEIRQDAEARVKELDRTREETLREARERAEAERKELLHKAEKEARSRLERFRRIMEEEQDNLLDRIRGELGETIVEVAGAVLRDSADFEALADGELERLAKQLGDLPEKEIAGAREAVKKAEGRVKVFCAGDASEDQKQRLNKMLGEKLGEDGFRLEIERDPGLLAGWRLELGPVHLVANWRAAIEEQLERSYAERKKEADSEDDEDNGEQR